MDEEDTKLCTNCKRDIPAVNYTTHSVHCARNIRPCPVCKEPVPAAQLAHHHDALHKEVPCKKCGESVCGTDLEDHIRDSCAQTIKPCRYCELELARSALPAHEAYCGARSEQCADCREYVMAKYRQLHLDSNHGFIRLDEDPAPMPKPKAKPNGLLSATTSSSAFRRPATEIRHFDPGDNRLAEARSSNAAGDRIAETASSNRVTGDSRLGVSNGHAGDRIVQARSFNGSGDRVDARALNGVRVPKRNNDQPQVNTSVQPVEKINKELPCRGAVKKRPAPPPPDARRDSAYASAARRAQQEDTRRQEQTAYNLSVGLPPALSAAAKLDKLRKMDALHNRELDTQDYKNCLQGRVWQPIDVPVGHVLGSSAPRGRRAGPSPAVGGAGAQDLSHLQPMTPAQFMNRFQELQLGAETGARAARADRFDEIKSSLRELRRGLNEVTAPYNTPPNASNADIDNEREWAAEPELQLPCEFCGEPVPADELVLHQTGCRPDLARLTPRAARGARLAARDERLAARDEPVIPCEFCAEALPVYLISEHQERCGRDSNILYPD